MTARFQRFFIASPQADKIIFCESICPDFREYAGNPAHRLVRGDGMKRKLMGLLVLFIGAICFHVQVRTAVLESGRRCFAVLIPSLYFFSILAGMFIKSGVLQAIPKKLQLLAVVIFSQFGGYPVGAQMVHAMRMNDEISEQEERNLVCICFGCGAGFLLGTVCRNLSPLMGMWVMISVSLPNLILYPFFVKYGGNFEKFAQKKPFVILVTESVENTAQAMLKITAMVTAFAGVMGIFEGIMAYFPETLPKYTTFVRSVLEVSNVTEYMQSGGTLPMSVALLAFGGICVHLQASAICNGNFSWLLFWEMRILSAIMAYFICELGLMLFPDVAQTALQNVTAELYQGNIMSGICLFIMSILVMKKENFLKS